MSFDLVLVGGGLANGLLAYRLARLRPELSVLVLESGARAGGNHTWSFHASDLTPSEAAWVDPFVVHRWPGYDVAFPGFSRRLGIGYRSVASERFASLVAEALGPKLRCGAEAAIVEPRRVVLARRSAPPPWWTGAGRGRPPILALAIKYSSGWKSGSRIRTGSRCRS